MQYISIENNPISHPRVAVGMMGVVSQKFSKRTTNPYREEVVEDVQVYKASDSSTLFLDPLAEKISFNL